MIEQEKILDTMSQFSNSKKCSKNFENVFSIKKKSRSPFLFKNKTIPFFSVVKRIQTNLIVIHNVISYTISQQIRAQ